MNNDITDLYENLVLKDELNNTDEAGAYLSSVIAESREKILCGPQCKREKRLEELRQNYLGAENNMINAPSNVEKTRKEYYVAKMGVEEYNKVMKQEYTEKSKNIKDELTNKFNKNMAEAQGALDTWNIVKTNYDNVNRLYLKYSQETHNLERDIERTEKDLITNNRKTIYENQGISSLQYWYSLFKWLYIIIFIIFVSLLITTPSFYEKLYSNIFISLLFVIYPFTILYLIDGVKNIFSDLGNYLPMKAYE